MKVGDKVESADPATGKHEGTRAVTATWINHDADLVDVTVTGSDGEPATLHTTSKHPFWDDATHGWVPAGKLKPGHALNTVANLHATVLSVHATPGAANRWNLTVAQLHTYYVVAGGTPILVHNACKVVMENRAGRFGDMDPGVPGDGLTPHHVPQDALHFLPRDEGGAIVMKQADHALTRTYGARGRATKAADAGLSFRDVLTMDIWDMRRIGQIQYGDPTYFNPGVRDLLAYYRRIGMI